VGQPNMKQYKKMVGGVVLALSTLTFLLYFIPVFAQVTVTAVQLATTSTSTLKIENIKFKTITHQQDVWISALAWCESHGNEKAINPVDKDNTPSYGEFQFKPQTFATLSKRYGITGEIMDGSVQRKIVENMVLDKTISNNELKYTQFPDCIQRHIGLPQR